MSELLNAALACAARGWHVFLLIPGGKRPAIKNWDQRATTDPAVITHGWTNGAYNIGIACGPSHLLVVDLDTPKHPGDTPPPPWHDQDVHTGADVLAHLATDQDPGWRETFTVATPSGGTHLYYQAPAGRTYRNTTGTLGWKIDTRAAGGLVVAPGSQTAKGPYTVLNDAPPAPLPHWLADLLAPAPLRPSGPLTVPLLRGSDRRTRYLNAAITRSITAVLTSPEQRHNACLFGAAASLGELIAGGELTESEVFPALMDAARAVGQGEGEAARTIRSGFRHGAQRPRTLAA
ncbi:bifunctional DNA primase/polymerase-like protein [Streptomyces sp. 846.5]|nr:bifunctional DNA primase/polymerase [Streptomyces sp. 846.5]TDU05232.1 bifunctional DNA primase/polymerase-like protein [Streptomyces sp. 846.5]